MTDDQGTATGGTARVPPWAQPTTEKGGPYFGELVDRVRDAMDAARRIDPSDELALELVEDLGKLVERMRGAVVHPHDAPADSRVDLPARGNVSLPPFQMLAEGPDGVEAEVTFRPFHEGEGAAHGGYVSLLFDELAGSAVMAQLTDTFPRTAYLKVDYRSLTPIERPLRARVWVEGSERRKLFVRGTLHDGDRLCAEMNALFVQVPMPQF